METEKEGSGCGGPVTPLQDGGQEGQFTASLDYMRPSPTTSKERCMEGLPQTWAVHGKADGHVLSGAFKGHLGANP